MRRMRVDEALRWAYRDELPKVGGVVAAMAGPVRTHGVQPHEDRVDGAAPNVYGVSPFEVWQGWPHPDAITIGDTVRAMTPRREDWSACDELIADLGDDPLLRAVLHRASRRRETVDVAELVRREAIMGRFIAPLGGSDWVPVWQIDPIRRDYVRDPANGQERWFAMIDRPWTDAAGVERVERVEVDGRIGRRHALRPGAYRKALLDPDPVDGIMARIDCVAWALACHGLAEALAPIMEDIGILPWAGSVYPWLEPATRPATVHRISGWSPPRIGRRRGRRKNENQQTA